MACRTLGTSKSSSRQPVAVDGGADHKACPRQCLFQSVTASTFSPALNAGSSFQPAGSCAEISPVDIDQVTVLPESSWLENILEHGQPKGHAPSADENNLRIHASFF
jgi:hypothetical protein